jgi:nicotinamide-nucleotide amidase
METTKDQTITALVQQLSELLQHKNQCIATAESCTGGMIASYLTSLAGASSWFERGFVTYSNTAKTEMLAVDAKLIEAQGAVSLPVAEAMAAGALSKSKATIALSVTGIAGPGGGTPLKPVGTVCFGWAIKNTLIKSECYGFPATHREDIRLKATEHALLMMIRLLRET